MCPSVDGSQCVRQWTDLGVSVSGQISRQISSQISTQISTQISEISKRQESADEATTDAVIVTEVPASEPIEEMSSTEFQTRSQLMR